MPPKKGGGGGPSKKSVDKAKNKIVEDKTFGLKNKNKSKKVEQYVKSVQSQVKGIGKTDQQKFEEKQKKKIEDEKKKLEADLFKPVVSQTKVPVGVDPKSVVCEFFKIGMCTKGSKCKFSHNLEVARKAEKIDIYTDRRTMEEDTMDKWDQAKLESVVATKDKPRTNQTQIVCKYFLEAIEAKKYGWFWDCPNGGDKCQYQHCLPPGFVLKSTKKTEEDDEEEEQDPIEDRLEVERAKIVTRTPITLESFLKWRENKKKENEVKAKDEREKKENEQKSHGKSMRSGREVFIFNPNLFIDDDDGDVIDISELPQEELDGPIINIDVTGTSIRTRITNDEENENEDDDDNDDDEENDTAYDDDGELINDGKDEIVDEVATAVQEDLFVEDDIPDISDDDESEQTET